MDKEKFFIGEDGLEYCEVCREPVERYIPKHAQDLFGMKTHPRQCACVRIRMEKERQERKEQRVLMTNFTTISNGVFVAIDKNDYIEAVCGYDLLILDDLGSERSSGFVVENVFSILDRRVCSGKPMIITTNLTVREMRETQNLDYRRIYDRVLGSCQPICIKGESHRREKGNQNKRVFEQIFREEESE